MNLRALLFAGICVLSIGNILFGQQRSGESGPPSSSDTQKYDNSQADRPAFGDAQNQDTSSPTDSRKPSPLQFFGNWRFRAEGWDWFQPNAGEHAYAFAHSLLRAGLSQTTERFEWLVEGAQDAILGLPGNAVAPGNQGQLGLGGTYYVANQDRRNIARAVS